MNNLNPIYSSLAQSVEHAAVNRRVVGSSPTGGAIKKALTKVSAFFYDVCLMADYVALLMIPAAPDDVASLMF